VAGLLSDPALSRPVADSIGAATGADPQPLWATLLDFLAAVAEAGCPELSEDELTALAYPPVKEAEITAALERVLTGNEDDVWESEPVEALMNHVIVDIRAAAPALGDAAGAFLAEDDPRVRTSAVRWVGALVALPGMADGRDSLITQLEAAAHVAAHRDERAALVLAMGEQCSEPRPLRAFGFRSRDQAVPGLDRCGLVRTTLGAEVGGGLREPEPAQCHPMISAISAMRNMTRYPEPGMTARPISAVAVPPMGTPDIISVATMARSWGRTNSEVTASSRRDSYEAAAAAGSSGSSSAVAAGARRRLISTMPAMLMRPPKSSAGRGASSSQTKATASATGGTR
jgi:hypothetical protein